MVRQQLRELQGKCRREMEKGVLLKKKNRGTCKLKRKEYEEQHRGLCQASPKPISQRLEENLNEPPTASGSTCHHTGPTVQYKAG
jgi:hypothetical protein